MAAGTDDTDGLSGDGGKGNADSVEQSSLGNIWSDGSPIVTPTTSQNGDDNGDGGNAATGTEKRKRGRPKGSGKNQKRPTNAIDLSGLEKLLVAVHASLAAVLQTPELNLDPSEAKTLADATARVARHYPILDKIGDKAIDHANLFIVIGGVYGSRVVAWNIRRQSEKRPRPMDGVVIAPNFGHGPNG